MNAKPSLATADAMAFPLNEIYEQLALPLPELRRLEPEALPALCRRLLVHDRDMTPTLEAEHGQSIHLRVLQYSTTAQTVDRLVVLVLDGSRAAATMGAIRIYLEPLTHAARKLIAARREAFGSILRKTGVKHYGRPSAYFEVAADELIADALDAAQGEVLYGRRNTIWSAAGQVLAEVVEILPPSNAYSSREV